MDRMRLMKTALFAGVALLSMMGCIAGEPAPAAPDRAPQIATEAARPLGARVAVRQLQPQPVPGGFRFVQPLGGVRAELLFTMTKR